VAGGRWKKRAQKTQRVFKPNLQAVIILDQGQESRVKLCMKCLKRVKKDVSEGKQPFLQLAHLPKAEAPQAVVAN
jgi:ribosomal protein L28